MKLAVECLVFKYLLVFDQEFIEELNKISKAIGNYFGIIVRKRKPISTLKLLVILFGLLIDG